MKPALLALLLAATLSAQSRPSILVHVTHGPDAPTRAALAFLVARTAAEQGHRVTLFLAGDGVTLLKPEVLNSLSGLGTGKLREHFDALVKAKVRFYVSGNSAKSRGLGEELIEGKPAEFALPARLLELSLDHDRMFTY
jgi:predicted peroxiredoxin